MHEEFEQVGRAAASLVLPSSGPSWVHRRVQSLRYRKGPWTEIRLSIDFDLPTDDEIEWVPITTLPKWPPLFRIDYSDIEGRPIPLLTSGQNGEADHALMVALADQIDASWLQDEGFSAALSSLTKGPETALDEEFERMLAFVAAHNDLSDPRVSRFLDLAANLITSTILWYPVSRAGDDVTRTIAKVAYHWPNENTDALWVRALRSMSWMHPPEWLPLPHIGGEANFHLEIEAPAPLLVREIMPPVFWWIQPTADADELLVDASDEAEKADLRPLQHVACNGPLAHAYVSGPRPGTADILFSLAAPRSGFVGASFVASLLIAAFVTAMFAARTAAQDADSRDAAVALLALVPAIIGYLVVRPSDPAIVRRHLIGVQVLVCAAAAIPVIMGVLLIKYADNAHCLTVAWRWSVIASWVVATMLMVSVAGAGGRQVDEDEH